MQPFSPKRSIAIVALQFLLLLSVTYWIFPHYERWHAFDLQHYHSISVNIRQELVPYRDFLLEYPPASLIPILLPQLFSRSEPLPLEDYIFGFVVENLAFTVLLGLGLLGIAPRRGVSTLIKYTLLALLLSPLLLWRYDLFPTLLTVAAVLAALSQFAIGSGITLGLGIAAKLYPVVLVPVFFLYFTASRRLGSGIKLIVSSIATTLLSFLPVWWLAPDDFTSFLTYHKDRGLQIESVYAGWVSLGEVLGLTEASSEMNYGAQHLVSPLAEPLLQLQPWLFVAAMAVVYGLAWWRFREESRRFTEISVETFVAYSAAALLAFMLTNKVFSPQYLIWLLAFLPLLQWRFVALTGVSFAATTTVSFVTRQLRLMYPPSVVLLNLRNFLLLGVLVWLLVVYAPFRWREK
ncbi:glycosyltransferase 87 family protein [Baaleninema sp.]|uniref:glycosyltransferase 87 family protein n=1 Tax=Baaleninema sp. TaxID=3101197 RepID=UPI003D067C55